MRIGHVRCGSDGLVGGTEGGIELPLQGQGYRKVVGGRGQLGVKAQGVLKAGNGFVELIQAQEHVAAVVPQLGQVVFEGQGGVQLSQGFAEAAGLLQGASQVAQGGKLVRAELQRALDQVDAAVELTLLYMQQAQVVQGVSVLGVGLE